MIENTERIINFNFAGDANPTAEELIQVLKSVQQIIPEDSRKQLKIHEIKSNSIHIQALFMDLMDLFQNSDYAMFWDVIGKIADFAGAADIPIGLGAATIYFRNKIKEKTVLNGEDIKKLLAVLNDNPNQTRKIIIDDFKDLSGLAKLVQKRGSLEIIGEQENQRIEINREGAEFVLKIANAEMGNFEDEEPSTMEVHLQISRVSFVGNEQWKARVVGDIKKKQRFITILDPVLLSKIEHNELTFCGKEVIDAVVREEFVNGKMHLSLIEYRGITSIDRM